MFVYWVADDRSESLIPALDERAALLRREGANSAPDVLVFAAGEPLRVCQMKLPREFAAALRQVDEQERFLMLQEFSDVAAEFVAAGVGSGKRSVH